MTKIYLTALFIAAAYCSFGQKTVRPTRTWEVPKKELGYIISPTTLTQNANGIPIYCSVLRYNDTTVLDIAVIGGQPCAIYDTDKTRSYDFEYYTLRFGFSANLLKQEQVLELVSKYRFRLEDNRLYRNLSNSIHKDRIIGILDGTTNELPNYITLTLEAVRFK